MRFGMNSQMALFEPLDHQPDRHGYLNRKQCHGQLPYDSIAQEHH